MKPAPKDKCPCGSGRKYKKCCMPRDGVSAELVEHKKYTIIRSCEDRLVPLLMDICLELGFLDDPDFLSEVFFGSSDAVGVERDELSYMLERWLPYCLPMLEDEKSGELITAAQSFLLLKGKDLRKDDYQFLNAVIGTHFQFYIIEDLTRGKDISVRNIQTDQRHTVVDYQGSESLEKGAIIYARICQMYGVEFLFGVGPFVIPPSLYTHLSDGLNSAIDEINKPSAGTKGEQEFKSDLVYRSLYFSIVETLINPVLPKLCNTDGDPFRDITLTYQLNCSLSEALSALSKPGTRKDSLQPVAINTETRADGKAEKAELSWIKNSSGKMPADNLTVAFLTLTEQTMTIKVNSARRAARVKKEVAKRLAQKAELIDSSSETPELNRGQSLMQGDQEQEFQELLEQDPEFQKYTRKISEDYWQKWYDQPIPMLKNQTPRQAARTKEGRDRLEALFAHYEQMDKNKSSNFLKMDVASIRRELDLDLQDYQ